VQKETISVFDIFKIGIGPSSSHTLGPWRAAQRFTDGLSMNGDLQKVVAVRILLYGSLAKTGVGHGTDVAVLLGMSGEDPVTFDVSKIDSTMLDIAEKKQLNIGGEKLITFNPSEDLVFLMDESLPFHPNAVSFFVHT